MALLETLKLQTVLLNFALKCYPSRIDYVAHCLSTCSSLIEKTDFITKSASTIASGQTDVRSVDETTIQIEALLGTPLNVLSLRVLEIPAYATLMGYLPWGNWKELSSSLLKSVITSHALLSEVEQVSNITSKYY
jgi:hypothetical protein